MVRIQIGNDVEMVEGIVSSRHRAQPAQRNYTYLVAVQGAPCPGAANFLSARKTVSTPATRKTGAGLRPLGLHCFAVQVQEFRRCRGAEPPASEIVKSDSLPKSPPHIANRICGTNVGLSSDILGCRAPEEPPATRNRN